MSVAGISSAFPSVSSSTTPPVQGNRQAEDQASRQLVEDLESGNLNAAEQDYTTLSGFGPNNSGPWTSANMSSEFQTLGQDIQSGDLSGARSAAKNLAGSQLSYDKSVAQQDYKSGDMAAYHQAIANMQGDALAVYGTIPQMQPPNGNPVGVNVQA